MRSLLPLLMACSILFMACEDPKTREKELLQSNLTVFFAANYIDTAQYSLDSFSIVDIDTLTSVHLIKEQQNLLTAEYQYLLEILERKLNEIKSRNQQIRLAVMVESQSLISYYREEVKNIQQQADAMSIQADSIEKTFNKLFDELKNADSMKPIGFQAKCFFQVRARDKSVKRDTAFLFLNAFGDIVKREDLLRPAYEVNRQKFY